VLVMDPATQVVSPALLEANRRLYELRQQRCSSGQTGPGTAEFHRSPPWEPDKPEEPAEEDTAEPLAALPAHLGWGSTRLTAVLRQRQARQAQAAAESESGENGRFTAVPESKVGAEHGQEAEEPPDWVKLYPDIGLGMLREEQTAPGRLWLMLRYLDQEGRGSLRIVNIREQLTRKKSKHRLCGKRQLRNLLKDGEGVYWTREDGRLWLRSAAKVAFSLGVERLTGRPVALPIAAVLEGVGAFKAQLYAAFHSGRLKETPHGERSMPIARQTMAAISGVGRSSQRSYELAAGVEVQENFAIGEHAEADSRQEIAWRKGRALFELKDYRGRQGKKGKTYLCWQLPNSYNGGHDFRPRGRQRRINRELKDLVNKRAPGNDEGQDKASVSGSGPLTTATTSTGSRPSKPARVYYQNGKLATKAYNRDPHQERYWQQGTVQNGRFVAWQQFGEVGQG